MRLRHWFVVPAVSMLLLAIGCFPSSSHVGADLSKADEFTIEKGKTTEQQLIDRFGPPGNTTTRGDGERILTWNDARQNSTINGTKFIPVVGLFTGPAVDQKVTHRSLTVTVRDGIVIDYTSTSGNQKTAY